MNSIRLEPEITRHVVLLSEASSKIGMGHVVRSLTLALGLRRRGISVSGVTIGDTRAIDFARSRSNKQGLNWSITQASSPFDAVDRGNEVCGALIVIDCATCASECVHAALAAGHSVLALDYFDDQPPLPQAIINLMDHHPLALAGCPPARTGANYFEGPAYAIIRDEFLGARERRRGRAERQEIRRIVVTFGGADPSGNSMTVLKEIGQWPGRICIDVIVGPLFELEPLQAFAAELQNSHVVFHKNPENMAAIFADVDLIFCGAGGTLLEALCVGTPAIVLPQNDPERRHAQSLAKLGGGRLFDQVCWDDIRSVEARQLMSDRAVLTVDGQGVSRICDIVQSKLQGENPL